MDFTLRAQLAAQGFETYENHQAGYAVCYANNTKSSLPGYEASFQALTAGLREADGREENAES